MKKVAIVGAGYIGKLHADILCNKIENACVTCIMDNVEGPGDEPEGPYAPHLLNLPIK